MSLCETVTAPVTPDTLTPQFDRVRALHWCPKCKREKNQGLLVCWSCNIRLKRSYGGTFGPLGRVLPRLDAYLFDHNESAALSWLGEA
jgi:hypothetical protein